MIPPALMKLKIKSSQGRGLGLWLPLFLLWPFVLIGLVLLLPFIIIAEIILPFTPARLHPIRILFALGSLFSAMRGLTVDVTGRGRNEKVLIYIR